MPDNSKARFERIERAIENLHVNMESLHASVSGLYASVSKHDDQIRQLRATAERDGENIRALARIAEFRERRLTDLEGDQP